MFGFDGKYNEMVKNLVEQYNDVVVYVDFVSPPDHLYITSYAYIGVLSYVTGEPSIRYSPLNPLYCAPNKIFEYAGFALPMVGNDIPRLKATIEFNNMGVCAERLTAEAFVDAFIKIESQYETMSENATEFYDSVDLDDCISEILNATGK